MKYLAVILFACCLGVLLANTFTQFAMSVKEGVACKARRVIL